MQEKFHLKVQSRDQVLFDEDVLAITSYNERGKFDVLAQHANFISLINKGLTVRRIDGKAQEISFDNALMRVRENNVEVYVGVEGMSPAPLQVSPVSP